MADQAQTQKQVVKKLSIVQRDDGAVFNWTETLQARSDMRTGTKYLYDDGSEDIQLDKIPMQTVNNTAKPEEIRQRDEEIARLRQQLNEQQGQSQQSQMQPGEEPIPEPPPLEETLTNPEEEPIPGQEENQQEQQQPNPAEMPAFLGETKLQNMNKHNLAEHARAIDPNVDVDASEMKKADLIRKCVELQEQYK